MAETKAKAETEVEIKDLNVVEMLEEAKRNKHFAHRSWSKQLQGTSITINRGETLPTIVRGRHSTPYQPSITEVVGAGWYEVKGGK